MGAQTRKGGAPSPAKLKFSEKLVGKGLNADALQKKLKKLASELAALDQENVDTDSLVPVCKDLISPSILLHKDKGVKAYAACCLADILRLFAPDAPYTGPELRDIFQFFFRQLSVGLKGSSGPYYDEYFHLLESLSTVKSVVLVCDIPQAEELMTQIFRDLFGLVRQSLAKNIEMFMSDILVALIDECQVLPSEVLECIMAQFMDNNTGNDKPAFRLAVEVCNATSDKLQRHVCQYFTDNIISHAKDEEYEEVARCHELIKRLNSACPSLLHNVVPQLEEELRVEEAELRVLATQVLGEMFADVASGDLEKKYPSTWALWLARRNDKALQVRLAFVEGCKGLLLHHKAELREAVEESLNTKLRDPDEKVRAAVCKLYAELDYETALHYVSETQLRDVGERIIDKKQIVRQEALTAIGRLFNIAYSEIENGDAAAIRQFSWIPQKILLALTAAAEVKQSALQVIATYILPLPSKGDDEGLWTDRLLNIMRFLDEKAIAILLTIANLKTQRPSLFERYLECCIENNGGIIDKDEETVKRRLAGTIRALSSSFDDPQKSADDLQAFAKMNEQRLYKLLKSCMDVQTDLKVLVKSQAELFRRLEQTSPTIASTMKAVFLQTSLWIVNQSSIPTLMKRLAKSDHHGKGKGGHVQITVNTCVILLTTMSKFCPAVHRAHVSEYAKQVADDKNPRVSEVSLQALASVSRINPEIVPSDKRPIERLQRHARGTQPRLAKFAARVLAFVRNKEGLRADLAEHIATNLENVDPDKLVAHIAALVEIIRFAPDAFEQQSETIVEFLLKGVLMRSTSDDATNMETDGDVDEWTSDEILPALAKAKVLSLKVLRHRTLVHSSSESSMDVANPVLKLFITLLENGGALREEVRDGPTVKSRLRLQAACSLLHLATVDRFSDARSSNFILLALTIQDSCFEVRQVFLKKLTTFMSANKLPPRYNVILFMTVHDPEEEIVEKSRSVVKLMLKRSPPDVKLSHWEMIFIRLLHTISHHPDFSLEVDQIVQSAKYIREYLDLVATPDNVSLLYHLAQKCKIVRDADSHVNSEMLYATSELAQELIQRHARSRQWALSSYPGKVKLPADIFRPLPSEGARSEILKRAYLPEETVRKLEEYFGPGKSKHDRGTGVKRKAASAVNGSAKRSKNASRRRKRPLSDEDGGNDNDNDMSDDAEMVATSSPPYSARTESDGEVQRHDEEDNSVAKEEDLGRGARSRAKMKAQNKPRRKEKPKSTSSSFE